MIINYSMKNPQTLLLIALTLFLLSAIPFAASAQDTPDTPEIVHDENCPHSQQPDSAALTSATTVDPTAEDPTAPVKEEEIPQMTWLNFLLSGKYLAFLIVAIVAFVLLFGNFINIWVRVIMMVMAFVLFGIDQFYPLHPSPMCAVTKLFMFKFTWGQFFPAFIAMFVAIFLPSLIGRKIFCGWVCPLGAFQELINKIPFPKKIKQFNFTAFNSLRGGLFLLFFLVFFTVKNQITALGEQTGADMTGNIWTAYTSFSVYDPVNFFELLHWSPSTTFWFMLTILVFASLMLYRPFCYAICPIGFLSWLFEKISPGRIRVDMNTCNMCKICITKSPCPTIKPLLEGKSWTLPDCTSCGECINTCPKNSISFGFTSKKSESKA